MGKSKQTPAKPGKENEMNPIFGTLDAAVAAGYNVHVHAFRQVDDGNGGVAVMVFDTLDAAELWDKQN